jgi:hypothetical protein
MKNLVKIEAQLGKRHTHDSHVLASNRFHYRLSSRHGVHGANDCTRTKDAGAIHGFDYFCVEWNTARGARFLYQHW